ncbi:WD40 repeat protein [Spironucleus salmonicida]|uniref:WD40 repeat protein n=1 Tax=Spironucleus salmonicida TaxID=348837 RepID=V6LRD0_9EUKA|nr:WD40 repeat protein [Spironucleus salmonicida]|eukprot:EST47202.1 Hypothetical protein SS50377_12712 [Spironucleus salmonicida]
MQLTEIATIPPGAQLWSPSVMTTTQKFFIYASTHSIYIYQRSPIIIFVRAISLNNAIICAMTANEKHIVAAGNDKKVYFYDIQTFEPIREVLLARSDPPISIQFHHHIQDTVLLIYQGYPYSGIDGEMRSINVVSGQSITLINNLDKPTQMICSPHRAEVSISFEDGQIKQFGLSKEGNIVYERVLLKSDLQIIDQQKVSQSISNDQTPSSKQIIDIVNDFRKALREENYIIACTGISYDPKSSDYFLACWSFGIHVLFSSLTGQALQMYQPQTTGITSINYSQTISGRFYTTDGTTGVYREWNVSQNRQINEYRVSGTILFRTHVGGYQNAHGFSDALHFVDQEGRVTVIEPHNQKILYETKQNHSEAVLSIDIDPLDSQIFCTSSYDGTTRQWSLENFNYKGDIGRQQSIVCTSVTYKNSSITQKIVQDKRKLFQFSKMESGIQSIYIGNVIVSAYKNGLIVAFDKITGRPIINIFTPDTQYKSTLQDGIVDFITDQEVSLVQQKKFIQYFKIKCMAYADSYLYTGWRDSSIRIMKIQILESDKHGIIITSNFVASISIAKLLRVAIDANLQITHLQAVDNLLYVYTSKSMFLVFDISQFKDQCSNLKSMNDKEESQLIKQTYATFSKQKYFIGNMSSKFDEGQIISHSKSIYDVSFSDRQFNQCLVVEPSKLELQFMETYDQSKPDKIIHLVDDQGYYTTLVQLGKSVQDIIFKIASVYQEKLKSQQSQFRQQFGLTCVKKINDLNVVIGGSDGVLSIINWSQRQDQKMVAFLKSTKSDITTCHVTQNNILIGCFDGSIKIINYHMAGIDSQVYLNTVQSVLLEKRDYLQQELISCKQYFGDIYQIDNLIDILQNKMNICAPFSPLSSKQLYSRGKLVLFTLLYQFCQQCGIKLEDHLDILALEVTEIIASNTTEKYSLYNECQKLLKNKYNIYNQGQLDSSQPIKQRLQSIFKYILQLSLSFQCHTLLSDLFWELGLYQESLLTAQFVNTEYWQEKATKLTIQRMSSTYQHQMNPIGDRYQFQAQISASFFKQLKAIKEAQESCSLEQVNNIINSFLKTGRFGSAKILLSTIIFLSDIERLYLSQIISFAIVNYFCSLSSPIFGIYELIQEKMYKQAIQTLILSGEYQLFLFIAPFLRLIDEFNPLVQTVLVDQLIKFTDFNLINIPQNANQVDRQFICQDINLNEIMNYFTLSFDLMQAQNGFVALQQQTLELQNIIDISHYIRYSICLELLNKDIPNLQENITLEEIVLSPELKEKLIKRFNQRQDLPFCKQTFKLINTILLKFEITSDNAMKSCLQLQWICKHLSLLNNREIAVTKSPAFAKYLIIGALCSLKIGQFKSFRSMVASANRAIKKLNLQNESILDIINQDLSKFYDDMIAKLDDSTIQIIFNGRSIFENAEKPCYSLFCPMDRGMNWSIGIFN